MSELSAGQSEENATEANEPTENRTQEDYLEAYLGDLKETVKTRAYELAEQQKRPVRVQDVAKASFEYAPGYRFPEGESDAPEQGFGHRITSSITGLTIVTAILAIAFGLLGLSDVANAETTQGFLDIAKIFAGAVVGSAGESAISASRS